MGRPFVLFGVDHLAALALTALVALALVAAARHWPGAGTALRLALTALLAGALMAYLLDESRRGPLRLWDLLPLQLCDFLLLLAIVALLTRQRLACELLYFWAGAGTLLAMVTPDLGVGFPDRWYFIFFGFHGLVIAAAALLTFGLRLSPDRGAPRRAFLLTNAYAAVVGLVDAFSGANYLYLRAKPAAPTLLDALGPWPVYILAVEALALGLFWLLGLPFRTRRPGTLTAV